MEKKRQRERVYYEEEQSQGYNRRTMCSFTNLSVSKNV